MTRGPVLSPPRRPGPRIQEPPSGPAGAPWLPPGARGPAGGLDTAPPSSARVYDYLLGGKDNYAVDRDLAERALREAPVLGSLARVNRAFLHRATRFLAERAGLRQFVDIGCGLPAYETVDAIVRRVHPDCRVAYVDKDPMVLAHARALMALDGGTDVFAGDVREPATILGHPGLRRLIDLDEPVAVLLVGVLHYLTDADDPDGVVGALVAALPPGSHVVVSHAVRTPRLDAAAGIYRSAGVPFTPRSRERIARLTEDLEQLRPVLPFPADLALSPRGPRPGEHMPLAGHIGRKPA
ncbi:SAM-dependent methyltransferase [Actinomadura viridis]|uniref:SAM-dependent methyltransferase n=1 Tax=Actinomadura viridis TaxID=58110 RepID=UPI0036772030